MKIDMVKGCYIAVAFLLFSGFNVGALGQAIGIEVVVDTAFYATDPPSEIDPTGMMDGFVSYLVYAQFTNPTDVLSAVFSDVPAVPGSGPMFLDAPCGCFNPVTTSPLIDDTNNSLLWESPNTALYEYDTFWTIGKLSGDAPGQTPTWISLPQADGANICSDSYVTAAGYVIGAPVNSVAGDDLRIAVARVTTCGDWSLNLNLQVFIEGEQGNVQMFFLDADGSGAITVENPCAGYATEEANLSGLTTACAGLTTDVSMEFLGLSQSEENTTYSLWASEDNFESDSTLVSETASNLFPGLLDGDYKVYVENEFGCLDTTAFSVTSPDPIEAAFELADNNSCFGEADALIVLPDSTLVGGTGALLPVAEDPQGSTLNPVLNDGIYTWDGLECIDGDGEFVFTVSDTNGCTRKDTLQVNCPEPFDVAFASGDVVCAGDADGFISVEASGGSGSLVLTNSTETVPAAEGLMDLGPSIYQVYVLDSLNCSSDTAVIQINEPAALEINIGDITNPSCGLDCDGEVALTALGGSGDLDVSYFNTTTGGVSADSIGLCAGDYVATVTDTSGCQLTALFEVDAPAPLDFLIAPSNATCTGMSNGSVDIFPIGGTVSGYQEYDWVVLDTAGNVSNLNNLSEMTYTALVTDQVGCSYAETFNIGIDLDIGTYAVSGNAGPYSQTLQVYTYTNTAGSSYEWTVVGGDLLDGTGTNEISVVWNVSGPGSVCVVETNEGGCVGEEVCFLVNVDTCQIGDADNDGICDDVDDCIGEYDACGICNGSGGVYACGCNDIPAGDCDCNGNQIDAVGVCGGDCLADENGNGICDVDELQTSTNCGWGTYWNEDSMACVLLVPPYLGDYGDFSALNPCYFNLDNSSSVGAEDLLNFLGAYGQAADCAGYADAANAQWSCGNPVSYQGYDYATVLIGDQCWFAENLRNENYENGDAIPSNLSDSEWSSTTSGAVAVYGEGSGECSSSSADGDACDDAWSLNEYGRLYNWYAVDDSRGLCPSGWHVPTDEEWFMMTAVLGDSSIAGGQMKTDYGWSNIGAWGTVSNGNGTNASGFSGLPGGNRSWTDGLYDFSLSGLFGLFWSASPSTTTTSLARYLDYMDEYLYRDSFDCRRGLSVRCVQDAE